MRATATYFKSSNSPVVRYLGFLEVIQSLHRLSAKGDLGFPLGAVRESDRDNDRGDSRQDRRNDGRGVKDPA